MKTLTTDYKYDPTAGYEVFAILDREMTGDEEYVSPEIDINNVRALAVFAKASTSLLVTMQYLKADGITWAEVSNFSDANGTLAQKMLYFQPTVDGNSNPTVLFIPNDVIRFVVKNSDAGNPNTVELLVALH